MCEIRNAMRQKIWRKLSKDCVKLEPFYSYNPRVVLPNMPCDKISRPRLNKKTPDAERNLK